MKSELQPEIYRLIIKSLVSSNDAAVATSAANHEFDERDMARFATKHDTQTTLARLMRTSRVSTVLYTMK